MVDHEPPQWKRRRRRLLVLLLICLCAAAAIYVARRPAPVPGGGVNPISASAEAFVLPSLSGGPDVRLSDYRGTPVAVDLFASWCTACKGELPGFAHVSTQLLGRVAFVGVDSEDNGEGLAMARQYGISGWPLARDTGGTNDSGLHDNLGVQGMPVTALYDANGKLVFTSTTALTEQALRIALHDHLGLPTG